MARLPWLIPGMLTLACTAPPRDIRIGVLVAETGGRQTSSGLAMRQSAQMAERTINDSGGILLGRQRHRVRIILREISGQPDSATSQARQLLNRDSVVAMVGPQLSTGAVPVSSLAEQAHVPTISPMSTHPGTTLGKPYIFRIAFTDDLQGKAAARFARERLQAKRAALLYDVALDYSRNLSQVFRAEFTARGGGIVADEQFTTDQALDFTAQLTRIRAAKPDVIFAPNFSAADSLQVIQARRLGVPATFLGSDSWNPVSLQGVPEMDGAYFIVQWHAGIGTAESDSFVARYQREYGVAPDATGAATWDAFQVIFAAIAKAGSVEPDTLRRAIAATDGLRGVTGVLTYRGSGDPPKSVYIMKFAKGAVVFQQRVDP